MPGELSNCIAGRIANLFNFHGANYVTDAACASALVFESRAADDATPPRMPGGRVAEVLAADRVAAAGRGHPAARQRGRVHRAKRTGR